MSIFPRRACYMKKIQFLGEFLNYFASGCSLEKQIKVMCLFLKWLDRKKCYTMTNFNNGTIKTLWNKRPFRPRAEYVRIVVRYENFCILLGSQNKIVTILVKTELELTAKEGFNLNKIVTFEYLLVWKFDSFTLCSVNLICYTSFSIFSVFSVRFAELNFILIV